MISLFRIFFLIETMISDSNYIVIAVLKTFMFSLTVVCLIVCIDLITIYAVTIYYINIFHWII